MNPRSYTVKLDQESLDFARAEGEELAKAKKLREFDPVKILKEKVANSTFGSYAQQLLVEEGGARRVTRTEVPNFAYDVVVDHDRLAEFFGWRPSWDWRREDVARVEIKSSHMEGRKNVSFHDKFFSHALECARWKRFDYLAAFGVNVINENEKIAEVFVLGIMTPHAFMSEETFPVSKFNPGQRYLRASAVHAKDLGRILI
jgi:hypothetical protein